MVLPRTSLMEDSAGGYIRMQKVGGVIGTIAPIPANTTSLHVRYAPGSNRSPSRTARSSLSSQSTTLQDPKWAMSTPQQD